MIKVLNDLYSTSDGEQAQERVMLNEMGVLVRRQAGFGFEIVLRSNDHMPPHMHIVESPNDTHGIQVLIPTQEPKTIDDIVTLDDTVVLTNTQKKAILKALLALDKRKKEPIWSVAQTAWDFLHSGVL